MHIIKNFPIFLHLKFDLFLNQSHGLACTHITFFFKFKPIKFKIKKQKNFPGNKSLSPSRRCCTSHHDRWLAVSAFVAGNAVSQETKQCFCRNLKHSGYGRCAQNEQNNVPFTSIKKGGHDRHVCKINANFFTLVPKPLSICLSLYHLYCESLVAKTYISSNNILQQYQILYTTIILGRRICVIISWL